MPKNLGDLEPLNEEKFFEDFDVLEEDARKEKIRSVLKERNDIVDTNRKLFSRAKEAEGFKQDEEGNWIKTVEKKKPEAKSDKSDEGFMKRLDTMALKIAGITADDEVELFNKWKEQTGREADLIVENKIFQSELADLRTAKANAAATDTKGGGAESGQKSDPDYWIAKATKDSTGELLFPDDMPNDYNLRASIVERLAETSKDKKRFYNQK